MQLHRRTFVATVAASLAGRAAAADLPQPQELRWESAAARALPVLARWPAQAPRADGWPLIIYSHGLGGSRHGGTAWGHAWAHAGFVVLHLQHVGSDFDAAHAAGHPRAVGGARQLLERLQDVRAALETVIALQRDGLGPWSQVRPHGFGMAGHSFGAHTTLGMAGQAYPGLRVDEARLAAFVALSPTAPPGDARLALAGVRRPMLCVTGSQDGDVLGNGATPARRRAAYDALPSGHKALLLLQDADHMTFGGDSGRALRWIPRAPPTEQQEPAHQALVAAVTNAWWRAWLLDDAAARQQLRSPAGLAGSDVWLQD